MKNINGLMETLESLVNKEITVLFDNCDDITGKLCQISLDKDYLILQANDGKKAIVYLKGANMVLEGPVKW